MICLDTNYLICGLTSGTYEEKQIIQWYKKDEILCSSGICWYEFVCGPVTEIQIQTMKLFLRGGILSFGESEAILASQIFNAANRIRRLRVDAMIAASAISAKARLATNNHTDFESFKSFGLKLL